MNAFGSRKDTSRSIRIQVEFRHFGQWKVLLFQDWKTAIRAQARLREMPGVDVISIGSAKHPERRAA